MSRAKKRSNVELTPAHWIEARHTAWIIYSMTLEHLEAHPAISQTPELNAKAHAALTALANLTAALGECMPADGRFGQESD